MLMKNSMLLLVFCAFGALLAATPAVAQQVASGDLVMHYSAITSLSLRPEVARQYGLTRSAARGLLNIAVRRSLGDGHDVAVTAAITAAAINDAGQRQELRLREVREGDAIYYLAEVRIAEAETLRFEVSANVDGARRPLSVTFSQQFFRPR
jgi:D-aminopeptidase